MPSALARQIAKVSQSLSYRGPWGTLRIALLKLWYERKLGIDTGNYVPIERLDIDEEARRHARPYMPSAYAVLHEAFGGRFVDVRDAVLVDYGCGEGRVLLVAALHPFRKIIGVELSPSLGSRARANLERFYATHGKCRAQREVVTCDARRFDPPADASVFYFYKPFDAAAFGDVISRIEASLRLAPRICTIIYASAPETPLFGASLGYADILEARGWQRHPRVPKEHFAIFTHTPGGPQHAGI